MAHCPRPLPCVTRVCAAGQMHLEGPPLPTLEEPHVPNGINSGMFTHEDLKVDLTRNPRHPGNSVKNLHVLMLSLQMPQLQPVLRRNSVSLS